MEQRLPSTRHDGWFSWEKTLKSLLIIIIGVAVVGSIVTYYNIQGEQKRIIREAKNINLALDYLSIEEYASEHSIVDNTRKNGLSDWAEKEIKARMEVEGDVYLLYLNPMNSKEYEFWYFEGRYVAKVTCDGSNTLSFTVYRDNRLIMK